MIRYSLAVFNDSYDYIHHFLAYCREHNSIFEVYGFTNPKALEAHLQTCPVDMLLLPWGINNRLIEGLDDWNEGYILDPESAFRDKVREIVYLGEEQDLYSLQKEVNMFQPMSDLLDSLTIIAQGLNIDKRDAAAKADIWGIYSLDEPIFAFGFAAYLPDEESLRGSRILFVDLDPFSGAAFYQNIAVSNSLSDLIYYYRAEPSMLTESINKCAVQTEGLHYISPPASPEDLSAIPQTQIGNFFDRIAEAGNYDTVIINMPSVYPNLASLLGICQKIYLFANDCQAILRSRINMDYPYSKYVESEYGFRAQAFLSYLQASGRSDILTRCEDGYAKRFLLMNPHIEQHTRSKKTSKAKTNGKKRTDRTSEKASDK